MREKVAQTRARRVDFPPDVTSAQDLEVEPTGAPVEGGFRGRVPTRRRGQNKGGVDFVSEAYGRVWRFCGVRSRGDAVQMSSQILISDICALAAPVNGVGRRRAAGGEIRLLRPVVRRLGGWNSTGLPRRRMRLWAQSARDGEFPNRATVLRGFFRFRAYSAERFLKVRGVERPLACVMPTVFRALLRNLLSPRWSRPEWLRNQSGDRTVVPLCGATPPPETHPGPKARRHCVKLCLSGNRPAAGSWAGLARNSAGSLIVLGDPLIFSGAGSARALRAHQSYRERSFLGRQVSLNRGRKCNRAPRLIGALSHARISQDCKQLNRANTRRRGIPPRPMAGWRCPFCCVGDDRKMGRATRAT